MNLRPCICGYPGVGFGGDKTHWVECSNMVNRCGARTPNLQTDALATEVWNLMQRASKLNRCCGNLTVKEAEEN